MVVKMKIKKLILWLASLVLMIAVAIFALSFLLHWGKNDTTLFQEKIELLQEYVLADWVYEELGDMPAETVGNVIFLSVSDGTSRASVYTGTGVTLDEAWLSAVDKSISALQKKELYPKWVKADVVYFSETVPTEELFQIIGSYRNEFFRYGVSFDENFQTALLEAELNGAKIYDYENGGINHETLNRYLEASKRPTLKQFPLSCTLFQCAGWICDDDNTVYDLSASGLDYGRRKVDVLDADYAKELILNASNFLVNQVKEDGSFIYGIYPRFDEEIENYNIVRHASSLWSLICRYRLSPNQTLAEKINQSNYRLYAQPGNL
ncbi:hypothetical protein D5281_00295 [bacterium 1xD42-62]|uniref:Uncharacterized protein n=2 Tax=Parablautia muri TaxID=2320879 RepID=A0A9X5BC04_9FIRM|nr:hypothetical protein [Parablautia muri]